MNLIYVLNAVSLVLRYVSLLLLIPCVCAIFLKEYWAIIPFLGTSIISFCFGFLFRNKNQEGEEFNNLSKTDALAIVLLTWFLLFALGSIPFMFFGLTPIDALFESVSGVTATGATILSDFSLYPQTMFFWRSFSQWIGGLGILVLFTAILPQFSIAGRQMYFAEVPGSNDNKKLTPRIRQTAAALWGVYLFLTLLEIFVLIKLDMPTFDAICTSLSTIAAGGFSPQQNSMIAYASPKIIWAVAIFMFFAGFNFALQYKVFFKRKIKDLIKDEEFKAYFYIVLFFTIFIAITLTSHNISDIATSFRNAFFQVLSIITTTGFASVDYNEWNLRAQLFLFVLMFSGASIGSATGGVKLLRLVLIFKYMKRQIAKIHHPNGVYPIKINKVIINEDVVKQMISFVFFYYGIFVVSAVALVFIEQDAITVVGAAIATLGNIGPAFGTIIGPMGSYSDLHTSSKLISIFNMFIGRLELIPFLALLHPDFWNFKKVNGLYKK